VRAQDPGTLEPVLVNISCAPSVMSVCAHFLLLGCVQKVIIFPSNALGVQSDPPPPLLAYISATIEPDFCL
jgi:hypothetical protein